MAQCQIVDPAPSWKLIFSIQPHDRPGTTLNSFERCLKSLTRSDGRVIRMADRVNGTAVA